MTEASIDTERTRALRAEMVAALVQDGSLTDGRWRQAFLAVPRHVLVPDYYQAGARIEGRRDRQSWLGLVYSNTTLITQRRSDATITSSGTMPGLVASMLQALRIEDGDRVLQVATGTGYTAALLCERLGSAQVTSIDVDEDLTATARDRLRRCGYHPTLSTADGNLGYPDHAPYDRCIVTFGVATIPPAWIAQTRPGGVIVAPVLSGLVQLTVTGQGEAQGPFIGSGYFIRHRELPTTAPASAPAPMADGPRWPTRTTDLSSSSYYDNDFRFILDLAKPGLVPIYHNGDQYDLTVIAPDGSHAHVTPDGQLTQTGQHRVWDDIEAVHRTWSSLRTPSRERFGLTVTPQRQTIWLDSPDSDVNWPIK